MTTSQLLDRKGAIQSARRIGELLAGIDRTAQDGIEQAIQQFKEDRIRIMVLGKPKRGKSTLINAWIGRSDDLVAPIDKLPASSVITEVAWGDTEHCTARFPFAICPMKRIVRSLVLLATFQIGIHAAPGSSVLSNTLSTTITMITGASAVYSAANGAEATTIYNQKADVVRDLEQHSLNPRDGAIFQIYFAVDPRAAHRWIFKPNVYALVQLEGQGDFVPASIAKGYHGEELSLTVYGRNIRPGGRILVSILDDKEWWNTAWNSLLQTEISFQVAGTSVSPMLPVQFEVGGKIRLINKDITFQPPGYLATADIEVPSTTDGIWMADGTLYDAEKEPVGKLQFCQIWRADPKLQTDMSTLSWRITFWPGLAIVLGIVFISQLKRTHAKV